MAEINVSNWNQFYVDFHTTETHYYQLLEAELKRREVPDIKITTITMNEGGFFGKNRLYLQISRGDLVFYVCASQFGKGYFFSWWLNKKEDLWMVLINYIPVIGPRVVEVWSSKAYYQIDTTNMFKTCVHGAVTSVIEAMINPQGVRSANPQAAISYN